MRVRHDSKIIAVAMQPPSCRAMVGTIILAVMCYA